MSKKAVIALTVLILLLLGGGAFMMLGKKTANAPVSVNSNPETTPASNPKTLKDLLSLGMTQKCTYSDTMEGFDVSGTSYISSGKVRADFSSNANGVKTVGHTIFDGNTSYVWMDGSKTGFKFEIDPSAIETNTESGSNQGIDLNKTLNYECSAWTVDNSMFTVPGDVSFTSFTAPSDASQGSSMQGSTNLCAACDSLTGDQKTQCQKALKCN